MKLNKAKTMYYMEYFVLKAMNLHFLNNEPDELKIIKFN